jgi:hypothetical protein
VQCQWHAAGQRGCSTPTRCLHRSGTGSEGGVDIRQCSLEQAWQSLQHAKAWSKSRARQQQTANQWSPCRIDSSHSCMQVSCEWDQDLCRRQLAGSQQQHICTAMFVRLPQPSACSPHAPCATTGWAASARHMPPSAASATHQGPAQHPPADAPAAARQGSRVGYDQSHTILIKWWTYGNLGLHLHHASQLPLRTEYNVA